MKLQDIVTFSQGIQVPVEEQFEKQKDNHVRFLRIVDYTRGDVEPRYIDDPGSKYAVQSNDVIMIRYGEAGRVVRGYEGVIANNLFKITPNNDCIDKDFLYYSLTSDTMYKKIANTTQTTGMPAVNFKNLYGLEISLPQLKEQKKIAEILSSVDAAIEKTEQVIAKTEEVKKGLMQQLLTKGVGHTEFKQSNLGLIASNWDTKKLKEITQRITDGAHYSPPTDEEGLPIATVENMKGNAIDVTSCRRISNEEFNKLVANNCSPRKNDVLLSKDGTIGKVMVYEQDDDITLLSSIAIISVNDNMIMPHYLSYLLQSDMFYWNLNKFRSGSAIKRIVLKDINSLEFPIPTLSEQCKIVEILSIYDKKLNSETNNLTALKKIKLGLMQQLLTGQVRVKID